jgi:hypothetical protein
MKKFGYIAFLLAGVFLFGNVENANAQDSGSLDWRGTVDDTIQIVIRNRNARIRHISGRFIDDARFYFDGRAPRNNSDVRVEKRDGRGRVFIVQRPNRRNNFTTIVQIDDSKGGSDRYRFTLYWD